MYGSDCHIWISPYSRVRSVNITLNSQMMHTGGMIHGPVSAGNRRDAIQYMNRVVSTRLSVLKARGGNGVSNLRRAITYMLIIAQVRKDSIAMKAAAKVTKWSPQCSPSGVPNKIRQQHSRVRFPMTIDTDCNMLETTDVVVGALLCMV